MYLLNELTRKNIEKRTGMSVADIKNCDCSVIDKHIEKRIGKKLDYSTNQKNLPLIGRGTPYLYLKRILKANVIDKELKHI